MIRIWGRVLEKKFLWIAIGDFFVYLLALTAGVLWRLAPSEVFGYVKHHLPPFILFMVILFICFTIADLYDLKRDFRSAQHLLHVLAACAAAMVLSALFFYSSMSYVGRGIFAVSGVLIFLCASLIRSLSTSLGSKKQWQQKVLIVGAGKSGQKLLQTVKDYPNCGLDIVGFVDDDISKIGQNICGKPVWGRCCELIGVAGRQHADIVAVCITSHKSDALVRNLIRCHYNHITVIDMPSIFEAITGKLPLDHITDEWLLHYAMSSDRVIYRKIKRLFDIILSFVLLYFSSLVVLLATLLIKLDSKGELFYKQERVGMNFKKFHIIKFRTMVADAERDTGAVWASKGDRRITRVGKYLRKFRIDEIPQLVNVLMGDMSFVGPRPERLVFIRELEKDMPAYSHRLAVKPGITGWAQVMYPYAATKEESKEKLRYDLYYIKNMSILLDALIALKTVRTVLSCGGH
jgi:exopolysaccharide biosynthesis polyprenyl glycosylphosphotransferase